ncbi:MAG: hypothetical protein JWL63_1761 [Rhodocyclales bacterium]|nr:hypothetical protein [Rhodocyclales bacterium]
MTTDTELNASNETGQPEAGTTNWSLALNIRSARRARLAASHNASSMDGDGGGGDGGGDGGDDGGGDDGGDGGGDGG